MPNTPHLRDEGRSLAQAIRDSIRVRGARTHNLKNVSLELPRDALVVITGLSGSGKSSLAFDTLYAEGQRRYVESLSAYARQFLQLMEKPDVDLIEGLSPAIAIEQKATSHNPRSTVGTVTEIHDYLRLLFARVGTPYCPNHPDQPLEAQTVSQMVDAVLALPEETKLMVLAPVVATRKGEHLDLFEDLRAQGFVRVRVRTEGKKGLGENGGIHELDDPPKLVKTSKHSIDVVVDRLKVAPSAKQRLAESFETALRIADGRAVALEMDGGREQLFSNRFACPVCSHALRELEPRLFSFNNPMGACPDCDGLGVVQFFDPARVVHFPNLGLGAGAIRGWDRRNHFYFQMLQSLAAFYGFDVDTPFEQLPADVREVVLHGSGTQKIPFVYLTESGKASTRQHPFEGVIPNLERRYKETDSAHVREELAKYLNHKACPACNGTRLKPEARSVRVGARGADEPIWTISKWTLGQAQAWFHGLELPGAKAAIGERIVREISSRLQFLVDVGLDYLSLDRSAETLSGGESQRIRLASQIGSGLTGVMYVLDEPSIGLHQRDNDRLIGTLRHLRDLGNSVLVVEHDEDAIRAADHVVDMGPGAGVHGGHVVAQGTPDEIAANADSLTGRYLSGTMAIDVPFTRVPPGDKRLTIHGARGNNLHGVDVSFPVGLLVCVTGVSGSGKSTLVNDTLHHAIARHLYGSQAQPAAHDGIDGLEHFDKAIAVDQSPIGRTPRSNPATYTGLFTPIRDLFAETPTARERGYGAGRFSFNVKGGRCESCEGDGMIKVEMHFLPDVYVPCDVCHGRRYNRETLEVLYKGRNIAEVLDMTVDDAHAFFASVPAIARKLQTLLEVGLGYIRLGQSATTLSGGEAQRVKLSQELSKRDTGRTLYILDEPTTGLHFHDISLLLKVIHALRDHGNTVVVIEHNLDVIKTADWVIDMGPEGGDGGGRVVAAGTPEQVAEAPGSHTGRYLARLLRRARASLAA
ncbi:MAG: excinuclease ABC subunit UvrA [Burkholderiaceae bacterium]|nr:excinuclease ABC subunit UvrA [Burkholderiales bacterium]MCZ8105706.1 excinuclease ABC subunit UvrA [Burkholderiales bacterium]MCZ8340420.1 excinuclease ABC subunit UvrA [Burkholderiaceae bacterium]